MNLSECIGTRRSIRIFKQTPVERAVLREMVDAARLAPSLANLQPLRYRLITDSGMRDALHPYIHYAGYLPEFNPAPEQCPTAFIAVFADTAVRSADACECDAGLCMMSMCLVARAHGLDTIILGAIERKKICERLCVPESLSLMYLVGVGEADQGAEVTPFEGSVKYTMDDEGNIRVPKRLLEDILIED